MTALKSQTVLCLCATARVQCVYTTVKTRTSYRKQIARQLRTQYVEGISGNSVTLKFRLMVTQGHWKRNHRIDHTRLTITRVIWRCIIVTLKCGLDVTQGNSNWYNSKTWVRYPIRSLCTVFRKKHSLLFSCISLRKSNQFEWKFQTK